MPCAVAEFQAKNAAKAPESPTDQELSLATKRTVLLWHTDCTHLRRRVRLGNGVTMTSA